MSHAFRVIIIGGGPVGLTAAHCLYRAGIDFVVLERRKDVVKDEGASLVLNAGTLRVLHQLDILESVLEIGSELQHNKAFTRNGFLVKDSQAVRYIRENHGTAPVALHRAELMQKLFDLLPDHVKDRYKTSSSVVDISVRDSGVTVTCKDGATYDGSIVLGADGVHSKTRSIMRRLALEEDPAAKWDGEAPFPVEYKCMWFTFPRPDSSGASFETQHKDRAVMYLTGKEKAWIFLYQKSARRADQSRRYSAQEMEEFAASFADFPISEKLHVREVYATAQCAGMSDLEEGVLKHWSWNRIVLCGDSCHKFAPNAGLGYNNGVQDVVALCNALSASLESTEGALDSQSICQAFTTYQTARTESLAGDAQISHSLIRMQTWADWFNYVMARYVLSFHFVEKVFLNTFWANLTRKALVLEYLHCEEIYVGKVPWDHRVNASSGTAT